jgi:hypothetical protein
MVQKAGKDFRRHNVQLSDLDQGRWQSVSYTRLSAIRGFAVGHTKASVRRDNAPSISLPAAEF